MAVSRDDAPFCLTLSARGSSVTVKEDVRRPAQSRAATNADVEKQLAKLGGTPFCVDKTNISIAPGGFYPVSALNALRRNAVERLKSALIVSSQPAREEKTPFPAKTSHTRVTEKLFVRFEGKEISKDAFAKADIAVIPLENVSLWERFAKIGAKKISLLLPGFVFENDVPKIKELLSKAKAANVKRVTLPNITFLPLCEGFTLDGGYELNCISPYAAGLLYDLGFNTVCASPESKSASFCDGALVYGRVKLMETRNCIIKNCGKCTNGAGGLLRDRTGASFPVFCAFGHTNIIYNSVPVWLMDKPRDFSPVLIFTDETAREQETVLRALEDRLPPAGRFTRAYMG